MTPTLDNYVLERHTSPDVFKTLFNHLVFRNNTERLMFVDQVLTELNHRPDCVFILTVMKSNNLVGFVIAQEQPTYVWLAQAWGRSDNSPDVMFTVLEALKTWARALGKPCIRAETKRSVKALHRRFGFVECSRVVELTV